jgi:N-methylhydantoinase A
MFIGIDVGGTYTDGVMFEGSSIIKTTKKPVEAENIKQSLLAALDDLLDGVQPDKIQRVVLSTTVVTNYLAAKKDERVAVLLIPGTGLPQEFYQLTEDTYFIKGWIDFRGRIIEQIDLEEITKVLQEIIEKGIKKITVVGKFSNRNPEFERMIRELILQYNPNLQVFLGCEVAGRLNYPRRIVTTYYTALTNKVWNDFADEIEQALKAREITAAVEILKADGGTMPLDVARSNPCETIFSGPAASTMGAVALTMTANNAVVLDIGGTTTDISLLIDGVPLYASKGAKIRGRYSHINAFAIRSVPLGGDSLVKVNNGCIQIGPERQGFAACFGGQALTPTDLFNYRFRLGLGKAENSKQEVEKLARKNDLLPEEFTDKAITAIVNTLISNIEEMFEEWENEPAYKIWEVVNRRKFKPELIIGIGAAAGTIVPLVAEKMKLEYLIDKYSPVANALGACTARPTLALNLHVDTQRKTYLVEQMGITGKLNNPRKFTLEDAKSLARECLKQTAIEKGIGEYAQNAEIYLAEQFNMIRGWDRIGKIFEVGIQIVPGLIAEYKGVK